MRTRASAAGERKRRGLVADGWRCLLLYTNTHARLQVAHKRVKGRARLWILSARVASWVYEAQVRRYHTRLLARHYVKTVVVRLKVRAWLGWNGRRKLLRQVFALRRRSQCLRAVLLHFHSVARHLRDTARHLVCAAARCAPCFLPSIASCLDSFQQSRERERERELFFGTRFSNLYTRWIRQPKPRDGAQDLRKAFPCACFGGRIICAVLLSWLLWLSLFPSLATCLATPSSILSCAVGCRLSTRA